MSQPSLVQRFFSLVTKRTSRPCSCQQSFSVAPVGPPLTPTSFSPQKLSDFKKPDMPGFQRLVEQQKATRTDAS